MLIYLSEIKKLASQKKWKDKKKNTCILMGHKPMKNQKMQKDQGVKDANSNFFISQYFLSTNFISREKVLGRLEVVVCV